MYTISDGMHLYSSSFEAQVLSFWLTNSKPQSVLPITRGETQVSLFSPVTHQIIMELNHVVPFCSFESKDSAGFLLQNKKKNPSNCIFSLSSSFECWFFFSQRKLQWQMTGYAVLQRHLLVKKTQTHSFPHESVTVHTRNGSKTFLRTPLFIWDNYGKPISFDSTC